MPATNQRTEEVLVLVHPSWPFESLAHVHPRFRKRLVERTGLILCRFEDAVAQSERPLVIVGPYISGGSCIPAPAQESLRLLATLAAFEIDGGLQSASLQTAGGALHLQFNASRYRIGGFFRDLCCLDVLVGLQRAGANVFLDRTLSRSVPPATP